MFWRSWGKAWFVLLLKQCPNSRRVVLYASQCLEYCRRQIKIKVSSGFRWSYFFIPPLSRFNIFWIDPIPRVYVSTLLPKIWKNGKSLFMQICFKKKRQIYQRIKRKWGSINKSTVNVLNSKNTWFSTSSGDYLRLGLGITRVGYQKKKKMMNLE